MFNNSAFEKCNILIYFFNHRYDGWQLWQVQDVPGIKSLVWILSLISFIFLYPATFNLLEIAAIEKPQVHLYETGIIRISRHPQMVGQVIWCLSHTLWIGTSFTVVTSIGLIAHRLFAVWHGDRRLQNKYGAAFTKVKERTSVIPFVAILDGIQRLRRKLHGGHVVQGAILAALAARGANGVVDIGVGHGASDPSIELCCWTLGGAFAPTSQG